MRRFSQLDWPNILYKRATAILLGVAALFSLVVVFLFRSSMILGRWGRSELIGTVGAVGAFAFIGLLVCMGFFWLRCDTTSKLNRTLWFILLLLGPMYGSHIAYYALVYLPSVLRRRDEPEIEVSFANLRELDEKRNRIGPFSRALLAAWGFMLMPVFVILALPKTTPAFVVGPVVVVFCLWSAVVVFESVFSAIRSLYTSCMRRAVPSAPRKDKN